MNFVYQIEKVNPKYERYKQVSALFLDPCQQMAYLENMYCLYILESEDGRRLQAGDSAVTV